nr:hypothetical protein [Vibrio vulnificus]
GENKFGGILPSSIVNLSTQLYGLNIGNNRISRSIPTGLDNFVNLFALYMSDNLFTGSIPSSI